MGCVAGHRSLGRMMRVTAMPAQCRSARFSASTKAVVRLRRSIPSAGSHSPGEKWRTDTIPVALGCRCPHERQLAPTCLYRSLSRLHSREQQATRKPPGRDTCHMNRRRGEGTVFSLLSSRRLRDSTECYGSERDVSVHNCSNVRGPGTLSHLEWLQFKTFSCRDDGELARALA